MAGKSKAVSMRERRSQCCEAGLKPDHMLRVSDIPLPDGARLVTRKWTCKACDAVVDWTIVGYLVDNEA